MALRHLQTIALFAALALAGATAQADGKALYRWVDEQGQVHYGDKVPPNDSKQGRESLSKNGRVTKVLPRELSGSELEQAQARVAVDKAKEDVHQKQLSYDHYLLQSFASVADLQAAREERLNALDSRIVLTQDAVVENEKVLIDLRARAGDKSAVGALKTQIESFEGSLIDSLKSVRKLRDERLTTASKYTADIERFKGLRTGAIKQGE